ncbi:uncharacterized protein LTR77_001413 [Saxophila tyrrhenica]|uniref:Uncharacterized protein n=1 Tax=Saxophila tyrrhenica TaxID=1690608 RepID=A0AAV9PK13_9PEZI|nr:hypothetical protein LTR77_001413 [Saxophila tyrrhenica]
MSCMAQDTRLTEQMKDEDGAKEIERKVKPTVGHMASAESVNPSHRSSGLLLPGIPRDENLEGRAVGRGEVKNVLRFAHVIGRKDQSEKRSTKILETLARTLHRHDLLTPAEISSGFLGRDCIQ